MGVAASGWQMTWDIVANAAEVLRSSVLGPTDDRRQKQFFHYMDTKEWEGIQGILVMFLWMIVKSRVKSLCDFLYLNISTTVKQADIKKAQYYKKDCKYHPDGILMILRLASILGQRVISILSNRRSTQNFFLYNRNGILKSLPSSQWIRCWS